MSLYDRFARGTENRISAHLFASCLGEFARGVMTGNQAQFIIDQTTGAPLTQAEKTDATALLGTVSGLSTATAKLVRVREIDDVLLLADIGAPGYDTGDAIRIRLMGA